jgi:hypothetical protein
MHYKEQILASDFFTVETIRLKILYVFFSSSWPRAGFIWLASLQTQMDFG